MLETPLMYRFNLTQPTLSHFETMCLNILQMQCHSLPQNSDKIYKKLLKSFSSKEHKTVLILFLKFERSISSCINTAKSFHYKRHFVRLRRETDFFRCFATKTVASRSE